MLRIANNQFRSNSSVNETNLTPIESALISFGNYYCLVYFQKKKRSVCLLPDYSFILLTKPIITLGGSLFLLQLNNRFWLVLHFLFASSEEITSLVYQWGRVSAWRFAINLCELFLQLRKQFHLIVSLWLSLSKRNGAGSSFKCVP